MVGALTLARRVVIRRGERVSDYLGSHRSPAAGPVVFPVENAVGFVTPGCGAPDLHPVFMAGSELLESGPVTPGSVQCADNHTPYAPVAAGPDGLSYFTLRPQSHSRLVVGPRLGAESTGTQPPCRRR
jgi:hypothetical protein